MYGRRKGSWSADMGVLKAGEKHITGKGRAWLGGWWMFGFSFVGLGENGWSQGKSTVRFLPLPRYQRLFTISG